MFLFPFATRVLVFLIGVESLSSGVVLDVEVVVALSMGGTYRALRVGFLRPTTSSLRLLLPAGGWIVCDWFKA